MTYLSSGAVSNLFRELSRQNILFLMDSMMGNRLLFWTSGEVGQYQVCVPKCTETFVTKTLPTTTISVASLHITQEPYFMRKTL